MYNPRSRRQVLIDSSKAIVSVSALAAFLDACGTTSTGNKPGQAPSGNITNWYYIDDQKIRDYVSKAEVDAFNAAHSSIRLSYVYKALATPQTVLDSALSTGHGPDLIPTAGPSVAVSYANNHNLLALDGYAKQYNWSGKMLDWALKSGVVNGKLYSLPTSYETVIIHYNKTLFEKKGWAIPTTRSQLEALCQEIKGAGIIPFSSGNGDYAAATEWFVTAFFNHYAGPDLVYQALSGKIKFTHSAFEDAISLMKQYFDKGWFNGGVKQYFVGTEPQFDANFGQGKAAMNMDGTWAFQNWPNYFGSKANNANEWDWFPIPSLRDEVSTNVYALATGGTISINARSKAPDAAAAYLDWLYSTPKRVTAELADLALEPLPTVLTEADFPASVDPRLKRLYVEMGKATKAGNFGYTTWTFWGPKSDEWIAKGMDKVLAGDISPHDYCVKLDMLFTQELQQGAIPYTIPRSK